MHLTTVEIKTTFQDIWENRATLLSFFEIHINGDDMLCGVYLINRQLQTIFVFAITLIALVKT